MKKDTLLSYCLSSSGLKRHPGSSPMPRWYATHSQHTAWREQPGYVQVHLFRLVS
jgi:hypothetical protein